MKEFQVFEIIKTFKIKWLNQIKNALYFRKKGQEHSSHVYVTYLSSL